MPIYFFQSRSISQVIAAILLVVISLLLAVFGTLNFLNDRTQAHRQLIQELDLKAEQLASGIAVSVWNVDQLQISRNLEALMRDPSISGVSLISKELSSHWARDASGKVSPSTSFQPCVDGIIKEVPVLFADRKIGSVKVCATARLVDARLQAALLRNVLFILLFDCVLVLSLYLILDQLVIRPLKKLEAYAASDLSGPVPMPTGSTFVGEIDTLRLSLQQMISLLESRYRDLRTSEERLQLATQAASLGIWDWDIPGNQLTWDAGMYRLYGLTPGEGNGTYEAWSRALHPDDRIAAEGEIQAALQGLREFSQEFRILHPNGAIRHIKAAALTFRNAEGQPLRMVGVNYDLSEKKLAEAELEQYRHHLEALVEQRTHELEQAKLTAESANHAKSLFLSAMSHELRTPLNAILGFAQILSKNPECSDNQHQHLAIILKSGEHLLSLINAILDIARIEAGKLQAQNDDFDLGNLLLDTLAILRVRAGEKNLKLELEQSSSFPRYIHSDPVKLRQILINLIGNAIKFTRHGGVTLHVQLLPQTQNEGELRLSFEIIDTGPGIAPDDLKQLFTAFYQARDATGLEGTGLGLSIAKCYAELLGGGVSVDSVIGQGSCFRFTVSARTAHHAAAMPRPDLQIINIEGASECSILVVEDQLENRLLLNGLLQAYGFTVANAENGRLALDQLEIKKPDLILLDRRMPVMDGLEMLAKLRARPACQEIPVIAVTAQAFEEEKQEMLAAGCQDFLAKPFRDSDLYALLAKHLPIRLVTAETQSPKPAPQLSTAVLLALPENLRLRLRNLVKIGNITQLAALVPEVEVHQPELAAMISLAVTSYDLCTLTELCASYPA